MTKKLYELNKTIDLKGARVIPEQEKHLRYSLNHYLILKEDKRWLTDRISLPNLSKLLYEKKVTAESIYLIQKEDGDTTINKIKAKEEADRKKAAADRRRKAEAKKKAEEKKEEPKAVDEK